PTARRAPRLLRPGRNALQGGDGRSALRLHRLVRAGTGARGGLTALAAQEAAAALQAVRAGGDEMPRQASRRSLPRRERAARRSGGGGRKTGDGVAGALAGLVGQGDGLNRPRTAATRRAIIPDDG